MANTFKFGNGNWAVKDGYALAYNDENNNFKPLPFDFTRASTATRVNKQGLIETVPSGKPRIDFLDNTSGHLLLEPSRTNVIPYSQDFSNSAWTKERATINANTSTSPDGSVNASKIIEDTANGVHSIYEGVAISNNIYTFSCFVKKSDRDYCFFQIVTNLGRYTAVFDLVNGIVTDTQTFSSPTNTNNKIEDYGNGWYRVSVTSSNTASTTGYFQVGLSDSANPSYSSFKQPTYTGDGSGSIQIWGAQVEAGSYATSYIPTDATGSSVTRVAPICKQDLSQVVSSNTHTIYWEGIAKSHSGNDGFAITFSESDSNINNAILLYRFSNGKIGFYGSLNQSAIFSAPLSESTVSDMNTVAKYALAIEDNRLSIYRNGTKIISSTATQTIPTNLKWLQLNRWNNISALNTSTYKDLRYYNTALTDTELQNLTS